MALLNPPQILPNAAHLIYNYLALPKSGSTKSMEELREVLVPFGKSEDDFRVLTETVRACVELGLIEERSGAYRLSDQGYGAIDVAAFRSKLRSLIFDAPRNTDLWKQGSHGPSQSGARDFVRAVAWFLSLDVYTVSGRYDNLSGTSGGLHELSVKDFGEWNPIANQERWQSFIRWTTYLGLAMALPHGPGIALFPDPSRAIGDHIQSARIGRVPNQPLAGFITTLSQELPVIDGGSYREETMAKTGRKVQTGELSPSLSHALLRLHEAHVIELSALADAPKLVFRKGAQETSAYSHVSLGRST